MLPLLPQEKTINIQGPCGTLEASVKTPNVDQSAILGVVICCHPHPLHGGTRFNKVITTGMQAALATNRIGLRFDFRGVGNSQGDYNHGQGETDDLYAVTQWVNQTYPKRPITWTGFSFGAMIAYQALSKTQTTHINDCILIAPPSDKLSSAPLSHARKHAIFAENDELFPLPQQLAWQQQTHISHSVIPQASHFFHGKLNELKQQLIEVIQTQSPQT